MDNQKSKILCSKLVWIASIAYFMQALDATILHTALPSIARGVDASPLNMQAIIISYVMMVAALSPLSGYLADRFGTRRIFALAIIIFSLGSLLCACAPSLNMMIVSRSIQGAGGAMMMPVARLILLRAFPKDELLRVLNYVTLAGLIGPVIGPLLGGVITTFSSWQWIFLINLPLGLIGLLFTYHDVPDFRKPAKRFDYMGCLLLSIGVLLVTYSFEQTNHGTDLGLSLILLLWGCALLLFYFFHARKCDHPLFDLTVFRIKTFRLGVLSNLFTRLAVTCMPLMVPLMLQTALGYTPLAAGFMVFPIAVGAMSIKPVVPAILNRWRYPKTLMLATVASGLVIIALAFPMVYDSPWLIAGFLLLLGGLNSIQFTALNTLTLCDLDEHHASTGNTLLVICQLVALSFSLTLGAAVLQFFQGLDMPTLMSFCWLFVVLGGLTIASCMVFLALKASDGHQTLDYSGLIEFE